MKYYRRNYKYELAERLQLQTRVHPERDIRLGKIALLTDGRLILDAGFMYDGPSGPTIDTPDSMRGSAGHDALFELIKQGLLPDEWFDQVNKDFRRWLKEDGMGWVRRWLWYRAVQRFGEAYMHRDDGDHRVYEAP